MDRNSTFNYHNTIHKSLKHAVNALPRRTDPVVDDRDHLQCALIHFDGILDDAFARQRVVIVGGLDVAFQQNLVLRLSLLVRFCEHNTHDRYVR